MDNNRDTKEVQQLDLLEEIEEEKSIEEIDNTPQSVNDFEETRGEEVELLNYQYRTEDAIGLGGLKSKFKNNIEAIKTLKIIESEDRFTRSEEQSILARYVGWGGMSQAFDKNNKIWFKEYQELKEVLEEAEYISARASVNNSHYTSPIIIKSIYKALENFGYKEGNILELAMGIGKFFSSIPASVDNSNLYGVEIDDISGRISKQLYKKADIEIKGFEETDYPDNFFDIAISNVPFEIAERVGHESIDITLRYAHMFPSKQKEMVDALNKERLEDV